MKNRLKKRIFGLLIISLILVLSGCSLDIEKSDFTFMEVESPNDQDTREGGSGFNYHCLAAVAPRSDKLYCFTMGQYYAWDYSKLMIEYWESGSSWHEKLALYCPPTIYSACLPVSVVDAHVTALSRQPDIVDSFYVDDDERVHHFNEGCPHLSSGPVGNLAVPAGGEIAAISRGQDKMDLFVIGKDGYCYTATLDGTLTNYEWWGWWRLSNKKYTRVVATNRTSYIMDIFMIGTDGYIYTMTWNLYQNNANWLGPWSLGKPSGSNLSTLSAVVSASNRLHIYVLDNNTHNMYTRDLLNSDWSDWTTIGSNFRGVTNIVALSRNTGLVDLFAVKANHYVYTAAWASGYDARNVYRGWWRIGYHRVKAATHISATARTPTNLDVFAIGTGGNIKTAAWDAYVEGGAWRGWWRTNYYVGP
jgi:hypothetical protein